MNTPIDEIIQKAISEAKAGNKEAAKKALSQVLRQEPNNARAWYLLSQVVEKKEQAVYCLEKVLKLQSDNQQAKQCLKQLSENEKETENQQQLIQTSRSSFELFPTKKSLDSPHVDYPIKKCLCCGEVIQSDAKVCDNCGNDLTKEATQTLSRTKADLLQVQLDLEKNLTGWERYLQEQSDLAIKMGQTGSRYFWIFVGLIFSPVIIGIIIIIFVAVDLSRMNAKRNEAESNKTKARRNIEITRNRILEIGNEIIALSSSDTYRPKSIIAKPLTPPQKVSSEISKQKRKTKFTDNLFVRVGIILFILVIGLSICFFSLSLFINSNFANSLATTKPTPRNSSSLSIGENGRLQSGGDNTLIAVDLETLNELVDAANANDTYRMGEIIYLEGRAFRVANGTEVKVIGKSIASTQIMILEGEKAGYSGWVPFEWVIP